MKYKPITDLLKDQRELDASIFALKSTMESAIGELLRAQVQIYEELIENIGDLNVISEELYDEYGVGYHSPTDATDSLYWERDDMTSMKPCAHDLIVRAIAVELEYRSEKKSK